MVYAMGNAIMTITNTSAGAGNMYRIRLSIHALHTQTHPQSQLEQGEGDTPPTPMQFIEQALLLSVEKCLVFGVSPLGCRLHVAALYSSDNHRPDDIARLTDCYDIGTIVGHGGGGRRFDDFH